MTRHCAEIHRAARGTYADLLDNTSAGEMYDELGQRVLRISKHQSDKLLLKTGVHPSLEESDVKQYLDKVVLPEVLKEKKTAEA